MTTTEQTNAIEGAPAVPAAEPTIAETVGATDGPPSLAVRMENVDVDRLTEHEGNAREDVEASVTGDVQFLASVKTVGVRFPLKVKEHTDGRLEVIAGHRRLCAARLTGRTRVPCFIVQADAGKEAHDYIDMLLENVYRKNFTPAEHALALFRANRSGTARPVLSQITGMKPAELKTAITAGSLSQQTRAAVAAYEWDFTQLAALKPLDDDPEAVARVAAQVRKGGDFAHAINVEVVAREQAREQLRRHQALMDKLKANGVKVIDLSTPGMVALDRLADRRNRQLTPDTHADCPGHRALRPRPDDDAVRYVCADPKANDHRPYTAPTPKTDPASGTGTATASPSGVSADPAKAAAEAAAQALLKEGRLAWKAATLTRTQWLRTYLTRKTLPDNAFRFVTQQHITCANPLSRWFGNPRAKLLADLLSMPIGSELATIEARTATAPAKRQMVIQLAVLAAAHERAIDVEQDVWRWGQLGGEVARAAAAGWLTFLGTIGYPLSAVERALAERRNYTGRDEDTNKTGAQPTTSPSSADAPPADADPQASPPADEHTPAPGDDVPATDAPAPEPTTAEPSGPEQPATPTPAETDAPDADAAAATAPVAGTNKPPRSRARRPRRTVDTDQAARAA
ncbi:ParB/RepB/Spo0J family partition protein [Dactylosporangium siamense]|uniref:ParB-like N-terminal domain-containing protein n=1 Tax=Dactylosporangium siamense TaxID=685454 RepID=A0A919UJP3_9ACTN|nr:ParB N-terminal domain-containing protein [Dactylosporangium siamense]GIG52903.1 hypothetical protein Dsi01nite_109440 [Dactylosporangium siamense]